MSVIRFPIERTRAYREQLIRSMDDLPAVDPTFNLADVLGPVEVNGRERTAKSLAECARVIWLEEMGDWS